MIKSMEAVPSPSNRFFENFDFSAGLVMDEFGTRIIEEILNDARVQIS